MATPLLHAQTSAPLTFVRRVEAAMILFRYAGIEVDPEAKTYNNYPDAIDGQWYIPYLVKAIDMGMITPDEATGLIEPHRSITRAEFMFMLTRAFGVTTNIPYQYTDIPQDAWYRPYMGLSYKYQLLGNALNPNLFLPEMRVTHQQVTEAINRLLAAEPSLRPSNFPYSPSAATTPESVSQKKTVSPLNTLTELFVPKEDTTTNTVVTETVLVSSSSRQSVKNAILKLVRGKESLASSTKVDVVAAVNAERAKYNLPPLRANYYLEVAAQRHAKDMANRGYFSHYTPEGLNYVDRIKGSGYLDINPGTCSCSQTFSLEGATEQGPSHVITGQETCNCSPVFSLGENLAKGQLTVDQVIEDWMNSKDHRLNILRAEFDEIGIGLYEDVWVQAFGRLEFK